MLTPEISRPDLEELSWDTLIADTQSAIEQHGAAIERHKDLVKRLNKSLAFFVEQKRNGVPPLVVRRNRSE